MKVHRIVRVRVLPPLSGILALLAAGCGTDAERTPGGAVLDTLVGADTIVSTASEEYHGGILALDAADGTLTRRLVLAGLPGAGQFTVDPARDRLYVSVGDEAMVVAFGLEL